MKVATFTTNFPTATVGVGVNHVVKVDKKDGDESTLTLSSGATLDVKGTVAQVIAVLNA